MTPATGGSRLTPVDWCDAGLSLLRDEGMPALTIDRMCAALERTKGSFYHHFRDLDAFLVALLQRWEENQTDGPIRFAAGEEDPRERAARLDEAVERLDHRLELAVRGWGVWDERARRAVERVDGRRLEYLTGLYEAMGVDGAREMAQLEYVAFVGTQQVGGFRSSASATQLVADVRRAMAMLARDGLFGGDRGVSPPPSEPSEE